MVIGPNDMPSQGDTIRRATATVTGFDAGDTGADHVWDYSTLTALTQVADTAVAVTSTPFLYQFYFNNAILYPAYAASFAIKGPNLNLAAVSLTNIYNYFKKDAGAYRDVGFGATITGLPASIRRIPIDVVHIFPLEYGDMDTSFSAFELEVPTLAFIRQEQTRYNEVDGWGMLQLPGGMYPVLRVKSRLMRTDSIFINATGTGFTLPEPETVEYKWIAPGMDQPVLLITTTAGIATQARFREGAYPFLGVAEHSGAPAPFLYPNPATTQVTILDASGAAQIELLDGSGRRVRELRTGVSGVTTIALDGLAPGLYHVRSTTEAGVRTSRLVVTAP